MSWTAYFDPRLNRDAVTRAFGSKDDASRSRAGTVIYDLANLEFVHAHFPRGLPASLAALAADSLAVDLCWGRQAPRLVSQFGQLYRWFPSILKAITIVRPETLLQWHRAVFRRPFAE